MKHKIIGCVLALMALAPATGALAQSANLACIQSAVRVADPAVVKVSETQAMVRMTLTNGLSWPLTNVYLRYTVQSRSTGQTLVTDPVALTVEPIAPGTSATVQTPFFGLRGVRSTDVAAGVVVEDAADPNGNQLVRNIEIIGLGWTGRKSGMGCN